MAQRQSDCQCRGPELPIPDNTNTGVSIDISSPSLAATHGNCGVVDGPAVRIVGKSAIPLKIGLPNDCCGQILLSQLLSGHFHHRGYAGPARTERSIVFNSEVLQSTPLYQGGQLQTQRVSILNVAYIFAIA